VGSEFVAQSTGRQPGDLVALGPRVDAHGSERGAQRKLVEYQPGLRIDFARKCVEVDGVVVLREGPLELFICSVGTREHESIMATRVRPLHLFQALGLIGLESGSPVRFDPQTERVLPPRGERLRLDLRYQKQGEAKEVPAGALMVNLNTKREPEGLRWVFAGSHHYEEGRFGADSDGTIACVVDFANALIALDTLHSASNDALWLGANPRHVPPVGTACTLLIRAAGESCRVQLRADGSFVHAGTVLTPAKLAKMAEELQADAEQVSVVIVHAADAPATLLKKAADQLVQAGLERKRLVFQAEKVVSEQTREPPTAQPASPPGS